MARAASCCWSPRGGQAARGRGHSPGRLGGGLRHLRSRCWPTRASASRRPGATGAPLPVAHGGVLPAGAGGAGGPAFNLVSTFRYLDSEKAALAHLEGTRRLLKPEGLYASASTSRTTSGERPEHQRRVECLGKDTGAQHPRGAAGPASRRSKMRNRLRITGPEKDLLIEDALVLPHVRPDAGPAPLSSGRPAGAGRLRLRLPGRGPARAGEIRLDSIRAETHHMTVPGRAR